MWGRWTRNLRNWASEDRAARTRARPRLGLALGGGFARSLAHVGVLQVLQENRIPIHAIAGISSGSIVASLWASGTPLEEIITNGACTTFRSYAQWTLSRLGLASNQRMDPWLRRLLHSSRFEEMRIPLAVVATDLSTGEPVVFQGRGDVIGPVRASCAYPGLFLPVQLEGRWLVDGGISVSIPVDATVVLGATHVIAVSLPVLGSDGVRPTNMFQVVSRCLAIAQERMVTTWRARADVVVEPRVQAFGWDEFARVKELLEAGRMAATAALPRIEALLAGAPPPSPAVPRQEEIVQRLRQRRMRKDAVAQDRIGQPADHGHL
jgi:NTE family protein